MSSLSQQGYGRRQEATRSLREARTPSEINAALDPGAVTDFGPAIVKSTGYFHRIQNARGLAQNEENEMQAFREMLEKVEQQLNRLRKQNYIDLEVAVVADILNPLAFLIHQQFRIYKGSTGTFPQEITKEVVQKALNVTEGLVNTIERNSRNLPSTKEDFRRVFLGLTRMSKTLKTLQRDKKRIATDRKKVNGILSKIDRIASTLYSMTLELPGPTVVAEKADDSFAKIVWDTGFCLLDFLVRHEYIRPGSTEMAEIFKRVALHQAAFFCYSFFENFTTLDTLPYDRDTINAQTALFQERILQATDAELYGLRQKDRFNVIVSGSTVDKQPTELSNKAVTRLIKLLRDEGGEGTEMVYMLYRFRAAVKSGWANRPITTYAGRDDDSNESSFVLYQEALRLCEAIAKDSFQGSPKYNIDMSKLPTYHMCRILRTMASIGYANSRFYASMRDEFAKRLQRKQFCSLQHAVQHEVGTAEDAIKGHSRLTEKTQEVDNHQPIVSSYTDPDLASFVAYDLAMCAMFSQEPATYFEQCIEPILTYIGECYRSRLEDFENQLVEQTTLNNVDLVTAAQDLVSTDFPLAQMVAKNVMTVLAGINAFSNASEAISSTFKTLRIASRAQQYMHLASISEKYGHPGEMHQNNKMVYMTTLEFDVSSTTALYSVTYFDISLRHLFGCTGF